MRKYLLLAIFALLCIANLSAQKPAMLKLTSPSKTEQTALQWFSKNVDGRIIDVDTLTYLNTDQTPCLWVMVDRVGLQVGAENLPDNLNTLAKNVLKPYVQAGGNLLLTSHATQLVYAIGRTSYAPKLFGSGAGGDNSDEWGIQAVIGQMSNDPNSPTYNANAYDRRSHAIYKGLEENDVYGHPTFALIGSGFKLDHNCMWDLNNAEYGLADNPDKVVDFENKNAAQVLGTWQHVLDYCCAGIVEFQPNDEFAGTVLTCGLAAYDWTQWQYSPNFTKLTTNMINYLSKATTGGGSQPVELPSQAVYFPMEPSGNTIEETKTGKNFEITGALPAYTVDGAKGKCLRFDGYSTTIKNAAIDVSSISNQDITFSLWVAPVMWPLMNSDEDREDWTTLCGNLDDSRKSGFAFLLSNRGQYTFECWTSQGKVKAVSDSKLPCNKWSHLVGVIHGSATSRDERTIALYNNGQLMGSATMPSSFKVGSSKFLIGKAANDVMQNGYLLNAFDGLIDDVQIFNGVQQSVLSDNTPDNAPILSYDPTVRYADNILRPHFHGCPDGKWSNETHGLTYYNGRWHLFYQCNPGLLGINNQKWGHMTSANLYDWHEEPVALYPSEWYDKKGCWSGCLFENAAFNDGKPTIFYTGVDYARAMISMASPADDNLTTWTKYADNPIINGVPSGFSGDFRDCYFFENNGEKYIIVGCSKNGIGCATLHKYINGKWTNNGDVFFQGSNANIYGNMWEMPNITPMGNGKWLFTVSPLGMGSGVKCIYWIGTIGSDGKFIPQQTEPQGLEMAGTSKEGYGLLSPSIYQKDGKTILLGIVADKVSSDVNYRWGWAHSYSLPREVSLSSDGKTLVQKPYSGLEEMRVTDGAYEGKDVAVNNSTAALGNVSGRQIELYAEFKITSSNASAKTGFHLLKDGTSYASVYFSANSVSIDLGNLNRLKNDDGIFNGLYTGSFSNERMQPGSTVKLHVYLDGSILDVFVNDRYAFSTRVYPTDANAVGVEAFSTGSTNFTALKAWELNPKKLTTGIDNISVTNSARQSNAIYNLQGQKLSTVPRQGIYIRNGDKFIAK